ncbi:MAG: MBL fold metallo-hydrolase [Leptospirales bacterium]|nr:MBL fold metallo-hydrolase [Leptospirales bacterium]
MRIRFFGAAGTVTGSLHQLQTESISLLLDCGLYQGRRAESFERNRNLPDFAIGADAVVLSHAHIDHCGNIPSLVKRGFRGNIYMTPATRDLAAVMLQDSAEIQEQDAAFLGKRARKQGREASYEALYTVQDAVKSLDQFVSVGYRREFPLNREMSFQFFDAGHILGSAMVMLRFQHRGEETRLLFSGDLGRRNMPILRDPDLPDGADYLILESTYGDRSHEARDAMDGKIAAEIERIVNTRGKLYIPSFALERAQEILLSLHRLEMAGRIPILPVYLDSPLATRVTDVFRLHPECFDAELQREVSARNALFRTEQLSSVHDAQESRRIMALDESAIIIAGSGMCENGRIRHHLAWGLSDVRNTVLLVGFQAAETLGRKLKEGARQVRIFGEDQRVDARIVSLDGFSAHADREDLIEFVERLNERRPLRRVFLVHGEDQARRALKDSLRQRIPAEILAPQSGEAFEL